MKFALPLWEDRISPVLDTATRLLVVEVAEGKEATRKEVLIGEGDLSRRCLRIHGLEIDLLICGAVSLLFSRMLAASGVRLLPGISGKAGEVVQACIKGNLTDSRFLMPGCRRKGWRHGMGSQAQRGRRHRGNEGDSLEKKIY